MNFPNGIGERAIRDVIKEHPGIGEILARHEIACVDCSVGICLLKDVVGIHGLSEAEKAEVEREIADALAGAATAREA